MINTDNIKTFDSENMFDVIKNFPEQLTQSIEIVEKGEVFNTKNKVKSLFIIGMGGSSIGGDLLRTYHSTLPDNDIKSIQIIRNYFVPKDLDENSHVIVSSYSGNTEETLSCFEEAAQRTKNIICITTGGKLEKLANEHNFPIIYLPKGYQPRAAFGFSFFVLLFLLKKYGSFRGAAEQTIDISIDELKNSLIDKANKYSPLDTYNPAIELSNKISGKVPIIYSSFNIMDTVNLRWRTQFHENSKIMAFGNVLPEMNHNEINALTEEKYISDNYIVLLMCDKSYHQRIKYRFEALEKVLEKSNIDYINISDESENLLTRIINLLYLGDWVSFYLAIIREQNPTSIPNINFLKDYLSKK